MIILKGLFMQKLIKDAEVIDNQWSTTELGIDDPLPDTKVLVSLDYWNAHQDTISSCSDRVGLILESTETPDQIQGEISTIPVIAVRFPAFADGRGFSIGRLLRERFGYGGELRAVGAPIRDQLTYLIRVGFNAIELADHYDPTEALASLRDFSENYQTSVDQPDPLFKRQARPGSTA